MAAPSGRTVADVRAEMVEDDGAPRERRHALRREGHSSTPRRGDHRSHARSSCCGRCRRRSSSGSGGVRACLQRLVDMPPALTRHGRRHRHQQRARRRVPRAAHRLTGSARPPTSPPPPPSPRRAAPSRTHRGGGRPRRGVAAALHARDPRHTTSRVDLSLNRAITYMAARTAARRGCRSAWPRARGGASTPRQSRRPAAAARAAAPAPPKVSAAGRGRRRGAAAARRRWVAPSDRPRRPARARGRFRCASRAESYAPLRICSGESAANGCARGWRVQNAARRQQSTWANLVLSVQVDHLRARGQPSNIWRCAPPPQSLLARALRRQHVARRRAEIAEHVFAARREQHVFELEVAVRHRRQQRVEPRHRLGDALKDLEDARLGERRPFFVLVAAFEVQ